MYQTLTMKEALRREGLRDQESHSYRYFKEHAILGLKRITEKRWWDMLEVLPPLKWERGSVETFFVCEAQTGDWYNHFAHMNGKYYERWAKVNDRSTWITREEINAYEARLEQRRRQKA